MDAERFEYEGLDELIDKVRELDEDASYMVLFDRTDRQQERTVARLDLDEEGALQWLRVPWTLEDALDGACDWLRRMSASNTIGEPSRRYRVRVYGPKGLSTLVSGSFLCRDLGYIMEPGELPEAIQLVDGEAVGMAALGQYYAQFGKLLLASTMRLQSMSDRTLARMGKQLEESRSQIDTLIAATLEYRFREVESIEVRSAETREAEARNALVRDAVTQLAEAAKAVATMGASPELAPVVALVRDKPELLTLLKSEPVKELLEHPDQLNALLAMLNPQGVTP